MGTFRTHPGVIVDNRRGRRFVNEGVTCRDFPKAAAGYDPVTIDEPNADPLWLVFDRTVRERAVILPSLLPGQPTPPWVTAADSVEELAVPIDVPPAALAETVASWNADVAAGEDRSFRRGTVRFETQMSGRFPDPARLLAPIAEAPFHALRLHPGTLGTSGGPLIDEHGRVRRARGGIIAGGARRSRTSVDLSVASTPAGVIACRDVDDPIDDRRPRRR